MTFACLTVVPAYKDIAILVLELATHILFTAFHGNVLEGKNLEGQSERVCERVSE